MPETFNYELEAAVTNSNVFHGDKVAAGLFIEAVASCVHELSRLDIIKKSLFYGRHLPPAMAVVNRISTPTCDTLPPMFHNKKQGVDVIHAILGLATEAGELLEALLKVVDDQLLFDKVNAIEESGDLFWYQALLAQACGTNFDAIQKTNIAKLRKRYPGNFTTIDANKRNLAEERELLEAQLDLF
jgi:NTP pyrophosphatase (non-canonical NTP hydrolase)